MKNSMSWRLTRHLRFIVKFYRYGLLSEDRQQLSQFVLKHYHQLPSPVKRIVKFVYHKFFCNVMRLFTTAPFYAPKFIPSPQQIGLPDYIVLGVIDWHFRHQRPQQLALQLANMGRRVFYISPYLVKTKRAGFELEALDTSCMLFQIKLYGLGNKSIFITIKSWLRLLKRKHLAKSIPIHYSSAPSLKIINQLRASIGELLEWANCNQLVTLVQHPYWYDIASVLPNNRLVYDCMDYHQGFGDTGESMLQLEKALLSKSDLTITTSSWLDQNVAEYTQRHALIRNAGDFEYFSKEPDSIYQDSQDRRIIGYYGAIAEWFDLDLVEAVAKRYPDCSVLLIGNDTVNAQSILGQLPNITFIGEVPYDKLTYYLYSFDVFMLPFKIVSLTKATNPVKVYESLSAGKPVVTVDLPEMTQFDGLVYVATKKEFFLKFINEILTLPETPDVIQNRRVFAADNTWKFRTETLIKDSESTEHDPTVSVIVVTYNNIEFTKACLDSLDRHSQYDNIEIIVIDNASHDDSPEFLEEWSSNSSNRKLILNDKNRGFAAANNQGLKIATGDYLVFLNNDTYVTPGWIRTLVGHLKRDKSIGFIGPVTNNIGNEAKIDINYGEMGEMLIKSAAYTHRHIGQIYPLRTAALFCTMLSRKVYEQVGFLDEIFGRGFFEDDDYCRRIEQLGLRIVCADDVFIHHHLSASFGKLKQQERQQLFEENKIIYEEKWGKWTCHDYRKNKNSIFNNNKVSNVFEGQMYIPGQCNICGMQTQFFYRDVTLWRESLNCERCSTTSRYRSIAKGILHAVNELTGVKSQSLSALPRFNRKKLYVYDTQPPFYYDHCAYPLPDVLKAKDWIDVELSQYNPKQPLGEVFLNGFTNQNLEDLTFLDESFDIIITSDVMEHVRLDDLAHREIYRVLKPGGIYIFTVPHDRTWNETLFRVQIIDPDDPSKDIHLLEPEYHGDVNSDEDNGSLAYRAYGKDIEIFLNKLGFKVEYSREDIKRLGILNTELYYCKKEHK